MDQQSYRGSASAMALLLGTLSTTRATARRPARAAATTSTSGTASEITRGASEKRRQQVLDELLGVLQVAQQLQQQPLPPLPPELLQVLPNGEQEQWVRGVLQGLQDDVLMIIDRSDN